VAHASCTSWPLNPSKKWQTAIHRDLGIVFEGGLGLAARIAGPRKQAVRRDRLIAKYGSVKEPAAGGWPSTRRTRPASPIDFGVGGLEPVCNTVAKQRATPLHHWLVAHAHEYGWHPYKVEPWHWEYPLSLAEFQTGERGAADDAAGPVSFGGHGDDDEAEGFIEEMDPESARWFAGEPDELPPARTAVVAPRSEAAPDPALRSGEVDGEVEVGAARVRWRVRWRVG
jgi:hypothetical protein